MAAIDPTMLSGPQMRPPALQPNSQGPSGSGPPALGPQDPLRGTVGQGERLDALLGETEAGASSGFARELAEALERVDGLQRESSDKAAALARGEPVDLHEVMISMERSDVAFRLMLEVRNRMVDAWQTLTRTPI